MSRLDKLSIKALIRLWIEADNRKQLSYFKSLNPIGGHYTQKQKEYAIEKANAIGIRAASRLLHLPIMTIQMWLREKGITVRGVQIGFMIGLIGGKKEGRNLSFIDKCRHLKKESLF